MFVGTGVLTAADSKGFCPPTPPKPPVVAVKPLASQTPPSPAAQFVGTVMLMAVVSDKGYVCDAQVIRKVDKETDRKAVAVVRQWHTQPARKDGNSVPVVVTVELSYWRQDGEVVQFPATLIVTPTPDGSAH
jgi:TonB family protein